MSHNFQHNSFHSHVLAKHDITFFCRVKLYCEVK